MTPPGGIQNGRPAISGSLFQITSRGSTCALVGDLLAGLRFRSRLLWSAGLLACDLCKKLDRILISLRGGLLQLEPRLRDVERCAAPGQQHAAEVKLRLLMAFLGSRLHPSKRLLVVLGYAAA